MATATAIENPYSVKGVKSFQGREGMGYECSVYKDGKRIGTVTDVCNGGGMLQMNLKTREEETALEEYCKALPKLSYMHDGKENFYDNDPCIFIGKLVDEFENKARMKKMCKGKTCYRLTTDADPNTYWSMKRPFDATIKKHLQEKYGDTLAEIINESL
jgi:hypothetical protein